MAETLTANEQYEARRARHQDHSLPPLYKHESSLVCPRCYETWYCGKPGREERDCVDQRMRYGPRPA